MMLNENFQLKKVIVNQFKLNISIQIELFVNAPKSLIMPTSTKIKGVLNKRVSKIDIEQRTFTITDIKANKIY